MEATLSKQCEMIVGFLVPHRCVNMAMTTCARCGRQFCEEHVSLTSGGLVCLACQQGLEQPVAIPEMARNFNEADLVSFSSIGVFESEDDVFADLS